MSLGAVAVLLAIWIQSRRSPPGYIEYRGEQIKLSKNYADYYAYKNDPDNIDPSETSRVGRLVTEAPIAVSFETREEMLQAAFAIQFPGYGAATLGDGRIGEDSIAGLSIAIPRADKMRYIAFQCKSGKYVLIDDFIESDSPLLMRVEQKGDNLVYSSFDGQRKLVRAVKHP
jgi:hypothetical protein